MQSDVCIATQTRSCIYAYVRLLLLTQCLKLHMFLMGMVLLDVKLFYSRCYKLKGFSYFLPFQFLEMVLDTTLVHGAS